MKHYILTLLTSISLLQGSQHDFDAAAYAQGNKPQEQVALQLMQMYNIDLPGKTILDIGCGTGNITNKVAKIAAFVDGIDASPNMIKYALETYGTNHNLPGVSYQKNMKFHNTPIENFISDKEYDLALSFFCLHWVKDKKAAFEKVYNALKPNGNLLTTIISYSDALSEDQITLHELKEEEGYGSFDSSSGFFLHSDEEILKMLDEAHLSVLSYKCHKLACPVQGKEELIRFYSYAIPYVPFLQHLPHAEKLSFFNKFIDRLASKLAKDEQGNLILTYITRVIYAQKKEIN
jgi:trans-aconitate 2-methyltransferase